MISYKDMRRICTYVLLVCLGVAVSYTVDVQSAGITDFIVPRNFTFQKNLKLGTYVSPDVFYMQNVLNMSASTRVANSGSGSNQELTTYYGGKTRDAIARFQNVFAVDIAYEKSLATSTSVQIPINSNGIDVFTRAVLNKLIIVYSDNRDMYIKALTGVLPPDSLAVDNPILNQTTTSTKTELRYKNKSKIFTYAPAGALQTVIVSSRAAAIPTSSATLEASTEESAEPESGAESSVQQSGTQTTKKSESDKSSNTGTVVAAAAVVGVAALAGGAASSVARPFNFGGISTSMVTCTCSGNLLIYVQDVRGPTLPLIYQPGATVLYKYYKPTSGVNMLGQYVGGGVCLVYAGTTCVTGGSPVGTMIQLGTSLTIAPGL